MTFRISPLVLLLAFACKPKPTTTPEPTRTPESDNDYDTWMPCEGDCNDWNYGVNPYAFEGCDELDNNCDGQVDEWSDQDGDGWTTCAGDCDDYDPSIVPVGGTTTTYTFAGGAIPDGDLQGLQAIATIPSTASIRDIDATLDVTHGATYELTISLHAPDGFTSMELVAGAGGYGDDFVGTYFDDETILPINQGTAPFTGSFVPGTSLNSLDYVDPMGDWTLQVVDTVPGGEVGSLVSGSIIITTFGTCP